MHLEGGGVECTPYATQVVAHVFEEVDGFFVVAACESRFDETTADADDDSRRPSLLSVAIVPKLGEDPLQFLVSSRSKSVSQ